MTMLALGMGCASWDYVAGYPEQYDAVFRQKYLRYHLLVLTHGAASVLALVLGPFQFLRRGPWHRPLGYAYLLSLFAGALTGLPMACIAEGGPLARTGFAVVDLLWVATAWMALSTARGRRYAQHREWMIRSYALTFGAVLLRFYLYGLQQLGYDFNSVYPFTPWLSWVTSLAVAELLLARGATASEASRSRHARRWTSPPPAG